VARGLDTAALPSNAAVRAKIESKMAEFGAAAGAARLTSLAPKLAGRVDLQNPRRVARALEIAEIQGDVPLPAARGYSGRVAWLGLDVAPQVHRRWVADRARAQFDAGLVEEAKALRERFDPALPAFSAIGYKESWAFLDGEIDRETAIQRDAARNLAFAKRQRTWFRREPDVEWLDPSANDPLPRALEIAHGLLNDVRA
jgi:tRNA dimethylallyltransferase